MTRPGQATTEPDALTEQSAQASAVVAASHQAKPTTLREFERALRDMGFSKREATAIALHGFKSVGDAENPLTALQRELERTQSLLKEYSQ